ncbi:MAG: hypothetical protein H6739_31070 [Alphaproteobacteria bacterium]|nr:hypothetical protein [Alphaproteobacteria bacterium]
MSRGLLLVPLLLVAPAWGAVAQEADDEVPPWERPATEWVAEIEALAQAMRDHNDAADALAEGPPAQADDEQRACVKTHAAGIGALTEVSDASLEKAKEALAAGEVDRATHETRKIMVAESKGASLLEEARLCVQGPRLHRSLRRTRVVYL